MEDGKEPGADLALDLLRYCVEHPEQRFWQALCNWSGQGFIIARAEFELRPGVSEHDTWNWKGRGPAPVSTMVAMSENSTC